MCRLAALFAPLLLALACRSKDATHVAEPQNVEALPAVDGDGGAQAPVQPGSGGADPDTVSDAGVSGAGGAAQAPVGAQVAHGWWPSYWAVPLELDAGIAYLLDLEAQQISRWDLALGAELEPIVLGQDAQARSLALAAGRLYIGYHDGEIRWRDVADPLFEDAPFARLANPVVSLTSVGERLLAREDDTLLARHHLLDAAGTETASSEWPLLANLGPSYFDAEAYDPVRQHFYFFCDHDGARVLCGEPIDLDRGSFGAPLYSPVHGALKRPIRVSPDGAEIRLGDGVVYRAQDLQASYQGGGFDDARFLADGSLLQLEGWRQSPGKVAGSISTYLNWRTSAGLPVQSLRYPDRLPIGLVGIGSRFVLALRDDDQVFSFQPHTFNPDRDADGTPSDRDAFPDDPAAALDGDQDGYPDAWNAGYGASDGPLLIDAYPGATDCHLPEQGDGAVCDVAAAVRLKDARQIEIDDGGVVYLRSLNQVQRWNSRTNQPLPTLRFARNLSTLGMTYSPEHQRWYLALGDGSIVALDPATEPPAQTELARLGAGVLSTAGPYLVLENTLYEGQQLLLDAAGAVLASSSHERVWDPHPYAYDGQLGRLYFLSAAAGLEYADLDLTNHRFLGRGASPYQQAVDDPYRRSEVLRVSADGTRLLWGDAIYAAGTLRWQSSLGDAIQDAQWLADGGLVSIRTVAARSGYQALLERRDALGRVVERVQYPGQALRLLPFEAEFIVATANGDVVIHNFDVAFQHYAPSDDGDGDGIANLQDAFELDPAASVDTDHDGAPDAWNPGRDQGDSSTGLVLDAFPRDAACSLPEQGSGGECDIEAALAGTDEADQFTLDARGIVYCLSPYENRVLRWDSRTEHYLNPLPFQLARTQPLIPTFGPTATRLTYSSAHDRLYLAEASGQIQYLDLAEEFPVTRAFSATGQLLGMTSVGTFLVVAQRIVGEGASHLVLDANAALRARLELPKPASPGSDAVGPLYSAENQQRAYYARELRLRYETLDPVTGVIVDSGASSAYHSGGPIRVSPDGTHLVAGDSMYRGSDLTEERQLALGVSDAQWLPDGGLVTLSQEGIERWNAAGDLVETIPLVGNRVLLLGNRLLFMVGGSSSTSFQFYNL